MVKNGKGGVFFSKLLAIFWKVSIKTNVMYQQRTNVKTLIVNHERFRDVVIDINYSCRPLHSGNGFLFLSVTQRLGIRVTDVTNSIPWTAVFPPKYVISYRSRRVGRLHQVPCVLIFSDIWRKRDPDLFRRRTETLLLPLMVVKKVNLSKEAGGIHDFRRSLKQQHARRTQSSGT